MENIFDPRVAYVGTHLFLPKKVGTRWTQVKTSLTYYNGNKSFNAWEEGDTHLKVPKFYFDLDGWNQKFKKESIGPSGFVDIICNPTFNLWEDQIPAYNSMVDKSGIISLACGRGKTVIAIHAICDRGHPTFVIAPTIALAHQWKTRILEHTDLNENEIGWAQGSFEKWTWRKPIVIGVLKSVAREAKLERVSMEAQAYFGTWVFDECHNLSTTEFHHAAGLGFGTRWGLSATPYRSDGNESLLFRHLGPLLFSDTEQPNVANVTFLGTGMRLSQTDIRSITRRGEVSLAKLCTLVLEDERRTDLAENLISALLKRGRNVLVLSERVFAVAELTKRFKGSGWITGKTKGSERMKELQKNPVFATRSLAKEGLDKKSIDTVVILFPFTSESNYVQILGRAQRSKDPKIYFLIDNIPIEHYMKKTLKKLTIINGYPYKEVDCINGVLDESILD